MPGGGYFPSLLMVLSEFAQYYIDLRQDLHEWFRDRPGVWTVKHKTAGEKVKKPLSPFIYSSLILLNTRIDNKWYIRVPTLKITTSVRPSFDDGSQTHICEERPII